MNLKIKFDKLRERLSVSFEKIDHLEKENTNLKEENHKSKKNLLHEEKSNGGFYREKKIIKILSK